MKKKLLLLATVPATCLVVVLLIAVFQVRNDAPEGSSSKAAGSTGTGGVAPRADAQQQGDPAAIARDVVGSPVVATQPLTRAVVSTGEVTVHPESINRARSEVMRLVASWGGLVADEQTSSDGHGGIVDSTMTLRVPTPKFSEAMTAFAGLGKLEQQSRKSEDVTTKVIDNDARVRAAERSIRQIEILLGRAEKLSDIISIESDLARRQADLDSLKSQQAYLADQTSLSTINVYLSRSTDVRAEPDKTRGFLAGLDDGWTALKGALVVLLTLLGAALPFALALVVLGVPLWLVVRRRLGAARLSAASAPARSA